jgi:hypothetical protein
MSLPEWNAIMNLLQALIVPLLWYGIHVLSDIRDQLVKLNGRVTRLESDMIHHRELDDERTELLRQEIRDCPTRTPGGAHR